MQIKAIQDGVNFKDTSKIFPIFCKIWCWECLYQPKITIKTIFAKFKDYFVSDSVTNFLLKQFLCYVPSECRWSEYSTNFRFFLLFPNCHDFWEWWWSGFQLHYHRLVTTSGWRYLPRTGICPCTKYLGYD